MALPNNRDRWLWLVSLLSLETILAIVYWLRSLQGQPLMWLDFNGQFTLPSLLQALAMFTVANLALYQLWKYRHDRQPPPPSRTFLITLALFLGFATLDELFKIHLMLQSPFIRRGFVQFYILVIGLIPVVFGRDVWRIWRHDRISTILGFTGLLIFFLGGFCSNFLRDTLIQIAKFEYSKMDNSQIFFWQSAVKLSLQNDPNFEIIRIAIEELLELWGETILLFGTWRLVRSFPSTNSYQLQKFK